MSWVNKPGQTIPQPQVQMYNPNQRPENQWPQQPPQQQPHDNWYSQTPNQPPKQNYWQQPYDPQQYNQNTQPATYPEYYQNNLQYHQQYNAQNDVYGVQQSQPPHQQTEAEGWGSNWGWGDEDNSNIQAPAQNFNTVTDSFANDESWNWKVEDAAKPTPKPENQTGLKLGATGKRNKLETPQWSVESQLSQESSDDILQTSESDKSRMLSRSSTLSHSPVSGLEVAHGEAKEEVKQVGSFENKEIVVLGVQDAAAAFGGESDDKNNVYKRSAELGPKATSKFRPGNVFHGQSVNLETPPDNSEQPDQLPIQPLRKVSPTTSNPWSENNEAPINDRNQYLETAQFSDADLSNFTQTPESGIQDNDTLPPPGLRRMVPGQTVGGQESIEPPEGLHRMIPGESSSPETSLRQTNAGHDSEPDLQRSATIGADTPPVATIAAVNRSETIGADTSPDPVKLPQGRVKTTRRDSVEGQIQDDDVGGLLNSVRNLTVGEQADDNNSGEGSGRKMGRQESSNSEQEVQGMSPDRRQRRYREKDDSRERDRNRSRYSPDVYRDSKKYDRRRNKGRYEDDTDYYSDKERRHREEREYERNYSSLRKEKEKDKRRRDDRRHYVKEPRKNDYYYGRYEDEYENESRSRASSRSDSVREAYRERGHERDRRDRRHREKERHRGHRDPFNPYSQVQGYGYDVYSQYYQQYQYYENLRKTNPQAYAHLYRKFYQDASGEAPYGGEDRASVHSGRSSANDELPRDRYTRQSYYSQTSLPHLGAYYRGSQTQSVSGQYGPDDSSFARTLDQTDASLNFEDTNLSAQRLTPAKFSTAHVKASIGSGKLVKILPHYPVYGQTPTVELCSLEGLLHYDDDYQELKRFPGPLVKGVTHKKTIIEYCESKIKSAGHSLEIVDKESYILMWELLILLIRQNGMVVGADIAELLLKNRSSETQRPASVVSSIGSNIPESTSEPETSSLKEEEITNKFREYLLYGSMKEALEWAMKHGLWGHALFLASKLDKRTYTNVLMRFANGLSINDPLQTLYQLLSGRTPAAVTCVADEKWGDWRPHLAMILSNSTQRPELNCKAITVLGDTLIARGSLYAAQFCYLMAEVHFGQYGSPDAKLVLLGSNHGEAFVRFATNEAIHMTEIYEYARSLNDDDFVLVNYQRYKYILATRLADVGLLEKALLYLETISHVILRNPSSFDEALISDVAVLADRLKYYDLVGDGEEITDLDASRADNSWLSDLRKVQNDRIEGLIPPQQVVGAKEEPSYDVWQQQQQQYDQYQQQQVETTLVEAEKQQQSVDAYPYQEQQQYWQPQQQWGQQDQSVATNYEEPIEHRNYYNEVAQSEPDQVENETVEEINQPQISLPNQREQEKSPPEGSDQVKHEAPNKTKPEGAQDKVGGNGWFGGIFSKLSLKPKNQMKLPDDKNPTILWDSEKKRWVNTDESNGDGGSDFKPPPKMSELMPKPQTIPAAINPPSISLQENGNIPNANQPNMFKLQRNRNLKKSYVDVFNPSGKPVQAQPPVTSMNASSARPAMNFFIPQPVNDPNAPVDFLTPAPLHRFDENSQMSRWSSASSLSREVQSYTMHNSNTPRN